MRPGEQSASVVHGVAAASWQVSQRHLRLVKPAALQLGLDAASVMVRAPSFVMVRSIGSAAINAAGCGGQSRLITPKNGLAVRPFPSHARPSRAPPLHVPSGTPSFGNASPSHVGQG